jgi:hypothetical protein
VDSRRNAIGLLRRAAAIAIGLAAAHASAGTLDGRVLRQNGEPAASVRVDLLGPQGAALLTGGDGRFQADLSGGTYTVQVTEEGRRKQFRVDVPAQGVVTRDFGLEW